jgi:hypothetical protein
VIRIFSRRARQLVDETLAIELVRGLADAAPRAYGHVELRRVERVAIGRHVVARNDVERGVGAEPAFLHRGADVERDRPAIGVEAGLQAGHAHGAIRGADKIFLARPEHVDRDAAVGVRDHDGLLGLRAVAVAAEATAEVTHVEVDVLFGNPRDL